MAALLAGGVKWHQLVKNQAAASCENEIHGVMKYGGMA